LSGVWLELETQPKPGLFLTCLEDFGVFDSGLVDAVDYDGDVELGRLKCLSS
jgi:hypothetical protein